MDQSLSGRVPAQWDDQLERIRKQLPPAPEGLLAFYVKWIPWVAIVIGVISLVVLIVVSLLGSLFSLLAAAAGAIGPMALIGLIIESVIGIVAAALFVYGGIQMRSMKLNGWWLMAAGLVIRFVYGVLTLPGSIVGILVTLAVAWIHLQVKARYN